ncbi:MAG: hypothetical protein JRS35_28420 [Deltaproteobacteria bacterium]|nr:hypothetical protein [Deltaproteobacteria bacterium]
MSQWAGIRQMFYVDAVPRKQIARRFGLDVKTVRRVLERDEPPVCRRSPTRGRRLDPWRSQIEAWLQEDRKLTAEREHLRPLPRTFPRPAARWPGRPTSSATCASTG